jgi:hypothetical protein
MTAERNGRPPLSPAEERLYLVAKKMQGMKKYALKNPSHQEYAKRLGRATPTITKTIHKLLDKGYGVEDRRLGKRAFRVVA